MIDQPIKPLTKELADKAQRLGIKSFELNFSGGSDEGYLDVSCDPYDSDFCRDVEAWAWESYDYSGAGDGSEYGDSLVYDLVEKKVHVSDYFHQRCDQTHPDEPLLIGDEDPEECEPQPPTSRRVVVEHNVRVKETGEPLDPIVIPGDRWGDDFTNLCSSLVDDPTTFEDLDGETKTGIKVTYSQTFIRTTKSDAELLETFKN